MVREVYNIVNATFSYPGRVEPVLYIKKLKILRGKVTFIMGLSGSGKSTLLESLGLMNNTLNDGQIAFNTGTRQGDKIVFGNEIWDESNQTILEQIRRRHFSFLFQENNLFEHFLPIENVIISGLLRKDTNYEREVERIKPLIRRLNLEHEGVITKESIQQLSVGQRQRLAFIRALGGDFSVLFGDEPTGNLDEKNACQLYEIIVEAVKEDSTKSAIIVSHDFKLAWNYADEIVIISKGLNSSLGFIDEENHIIAPKEKFSTITDFEREINRLFVKKSISLNSLAENTLVSDPPFAIIPPVKRDLTLNNGFKQIFFKRELRELKGVGNSNLIRLCCIILLTVIVLGFSKGANDFIAEKKNDPLVNWLSVGFRTTLTEEALLIAEELNIKKNEKPSLPYGFVTTYRTYNLFRFWNENSNSPIRVWGRTFTIDENGSNRLLDTYILSKNNCLKGCETNFSSDRDLRVIVTLDFLKSIGKTVDASYVDLVIDPHPYKPVIAPVYIKSIVKKLPAKMEIAFTPGFYASARARKESTFYENTYLEDCISNNGDCKLSLTILVRGSKDSVEAVRQVLIEEGLCSIKNRTLLVKELKEDTISEIEGYFFDLSLSPPLQTKLDGDSIFHCIKQQLETYSPHKIDRIYEYYYAFDELSTKPNYESNNLSIYFDDLKGIKAFNDSLNLHPKNTERDFSLDLSQVTEKQNYTALGIIANAMTLMSIILATVGISLFLGNILEKHISMHKKSIGTLKAFGLGSNLLLKLYTSIIIRFLALAFLLTIAVAIPIGWLINSFLSARLPQVDVAKEFYFFQILDFMPILAILMIIISSVYLVYISLKKLLYRTPGNLVYNR